MLVCLERFLRNKCRSRLGMCPPRRAWSRSARQRVLDFARAVGAGSGAAVSAALGGSRAEGEANLPEFHGSQPLVARAEAANHWELGSYEVWLLRGNCRIVAGAASEWRSVRSDEAVLWIDRAAPGSRQESKAIVYVEGNVLVEDVRGGRPARLSDWKWFGRIHTRGAIDVGAGIVAGKPDVLPAIYQRGMDRRNPTAADSFTAPRSSRRNTLRRGRPVGRPLPPGTRASASFPAATSPSRPSGFPIRKPTSGWRSSSRASTSSSTASRVRPPGQRTGGSIDVSADRMVIWTRGQREPDLTAARPRTSGCRWKSTWRATSFSARARGRSTPAACITTCPTRSARCWTPRCSRPFASTMACAVARRDHSASRPRTVRRPERLFHAQPLGVPGYRMQSNDITFDDIQHPASIPHGADADESGHGRGVSTTA